ncbi:hypothetical protein ACHQM5_012260 [Ranunculus cassubicifolius]
MLWFLTSGNSRRVGQFYLPNQSLQVKKIGEHVSVPLSSSFKLNSCYSSSTKSHVSFRLYSAKPTLCGTLSQVLFNRSKINTTSHHEQKSWRRLLQTGSYNQSDISRVKRISRVRSFLSVIPRCNTMAQHVQLGYKRFMQTRSNGTPEVSPLSRRVNVQTFFSGLSGRYRKNLHDQISRKGLIQLRSYNELTLQRRKTMKHHIQTAWKRFSQRRSYSSLSSPVLNTSARAVKSGLNRSRPVAFGIFVSIIGAVAWPQVAFADAGEFHPGENRLYMHAHDGHRYLTSFIFSVYEGFVLFTRAIYLAFLFSPTIAMAPFADSFGADFRKRWLHLVHVSLEKAGPAFIKWGQWAATRPDLFPRDLCIELSKLHSKAPEHSYAYTKKAIENAFGRKILDIFDDFEEKPIASGSIAQVHRATLKFQYPGKKDKPTVVAVKVRHPGVGESIRRDFVIIHYIAKISSYIPTLKWLRLDESVQQFAVFMMSQVDLSREAAQLSRFIYNFRKSRNVTFPRPLYPLVHPAVLVESFEQGESVSRYIDDNDELTGSDQTKRGLADIGTHALLKMLLEDNFIHADMHPGNILVRENPRKNSKPHVIFLDVGMTAELSRNDQTNLRDFFKAVALRDGRSAAECTLRFSRNQNCPNPDAFIQEVEKSFAFWGTKEGDVVHPAECMHQLLEQIRRHKVNIDGNLCTVMVTTLVLEGWQRKLDPKYNIMGTLQSMLFKANWVEDLVYTINGLI